MDTHTIKDNLRSFYNQEAELRDASAKADWKVKIRREFSDLAKKKGKMDLLEIGAGAGYDSRYFMDSGFNVVAIDLSCEMVKKCIEKGIEAYELDYYELPALHKRFNCVWAMNTLLHVPKKELPAVLDGIGAILDANGLFYMGVYGGADYENEFIKDDVSKAPDFLRLIPKRTLKHC